MTFSATTRRLLTEETRTGKHVDHAECWNFRNQHAITSIVSLVQKETQKSLKNPIVLEMMEPNKPSH